MDNEKFRSILLKIANNLLDKDVEQIKLYYSEKIGNGVLEKITTTTKLITVLEQHMLIGIDNYDAFCELLKKIGRHDIVNFFSDDSNVKASGSQPYIMLERGFTFKFTKERQKCIEVHYRLKGHDDWTAIKEGCNVNCYYVSKWIGDEVFIKVENVPFRSNNVYYLEFKISFEDSEEFCSGTVKVEWNNKTTFKNLTLSLPKGITDDKNEFLQYIDEKKFPSFSWKDCKRRTGLKYYNINIPDDVNYVPIFKTFEDNSVISKFHSYFSSKQNKNTKQQKIKKIKKNQKQGTRENRKVCFLLQKYNLYDHASKLNIDVGKFKKIQTCNNSFVLFLSDHSHIIIARIVDKEWDKSLLDCIKIESENCLTDIILFINIYKDLINDKQLFISGILVLPTVKRESLPEDLCFLFSDQFNFKSCFNFLCGDELEDNKKIKLWLEKITKSEDFTVKNRQTIKKKIIKAMIGNAIMYMLDIKFLCYKDNIQKQITSLVLNIEQYHAILDKGKNRKKIITGGFGSGKSVVGKEIVRNIIKEDKSVTLYYICCNHFSLYEYEMDKFIRDSLFQNKTTNVTVICDNLFHLWNEVNKSQDKDEISIPDLLEHYAAETINKDGTTKKITTDDVCFVLEELSDEYFKEEDVKKLNKNFLEPSNKLNKCLVVFIPESIKKNSELVNEIATDKINIQKSCFTEEFLGKSMKIVTLKKSMRVTQGIKLLIDSFQKAIEEEQTVIRFSSDNPSNRPEQNSKVKTFNDSGLTEELGDNIKSEHKLDMNPNKLTIAEGLIPIINETTRTYYEYDSDSLHKYIKSDPKGSNSIEISCVFDETDFGHFIKGKKPKLIYFPFSNIADINSVHLLSDTLSKHCIFENGPRTVVICNNMDEVISVSYAIEIAKTKNNKFTAITYTPYLRKYTPSIDNKKAVMEKTEINPHTYILVTDYKGFSGAESESVIIFVDPNDIYLRHTVINAMARSNSHLTFLVLGKNDLNSNLLKNTVGWIMTKWTPELIEKIEIKENNCKLKKITDRTEEFEVYRKEEKFKINMEHDNMNARKASQTVELAKKGKSDTKKNEYESTAFELAFGRKSEKAELEKNMCLNESLNSPSNTIKVKDSLNSGGFFLINPSVLPEVHWRTGNDNHFPLTPKIVGRVGYLIGDKFDSFGRHLGLSQYDVNNIKADERTALARAVAVLDMWIERNGISNWEQLKKELLLCEYKNTVKIIENEFGYK
ncbi:uncharacterized protein LOC136074994 isoform X2 [Hydra vulgaris]|uniref:Uncharacterized protein LOC136074994 isoform X2 n=1 Tax=Hydra vulgaris TaxID=6087 RepID=A0ABM4B348_HYDVU